MIQESLFFTSKTGQKIEIRTPRESEAQMTLDMMIEVAAHSPYILSTPERFRQKTLENQLKWFQDSATSDSDIILAAFHDSKMVGLCNGHSYKDIKRKHRAGLGVSIHQDYRGCGLGMKLMSTLIENMKRFNHVTIIELDVMTNNSAAVKMYEKLGFKKAGTFPNAYILPSGEASDNLTMYLEA
ncbi:hypothetical protein AZI86_13760 [Bdellovibrio bacteriovorus]|uniref:N-acetyltransferase domain-containing protein n=2 Tax=Bdellovibrio bacteriovorus TaxID=959 RepID=A0A150WJE3_BDEBC|nr:hypothetical protein AZI86_13760 [Bdellovibrio bacteriovorus]